MANKRCPHCYCINVTKNGVRNNRQRYHCNICNHSWTSTTRPERLVAKIWHEYAFECRTVRQLAFSHGISPKRIRQALNDYQLPIAADNPRPVSIVMDVTYFGSWGVLVVIDPYANKAKGQNMVLYHKIIDSTETNYDYAVALFSLISRGYKVKAAVIDGRRGVRQILLNQGIFVQHCQFHQLQTITQCLTRNPKLPANIELRSIALQLTKLTEAGLSKCLDIWYEEYGDWLKERDPSTKQFIHRRTRRAYFSLRRNLPYLFPYKNKKLSKLNIKIPNTTNALDGRFGAWKFKLKTHRGCTKTLKTKILFSLLSEATGVENNPN
jgi:hypothetical protein